MQFKTKLMIKVLKEVPGEKRTTDFFCILKVPLIDYFKSSLFVLNKLNVKYLT